MFPCEHPSLSLTYTHQLALAFYYVILNNSYTWHTLITHHDKKKSSVMITYLLYTSFKNYFSDNYYCND